MRGKNTIIINGFRYDAVTGRPLGNQGLAASESRPVVNRSKGTAMSDVGGRRVTQRAAEPVVIANTAPAKAAPPAITPAPPAAKKPRVTTAPTVVHKKPQKSQTLHRRAIKRPEPYVKPVDAAQRSPMISKFAPHPKALPKAATPAVAAVAQTATYPSATVVQSLATSPRPTSNVQPTPARSSKQLKEDLIKQRLASVDDAPKNKRPSPLQQLAKKQPRAMNIMTMSLALIMIGGYMTYINMPNLSVRVASSRAGVQANFPEYRPDGYSFSGPVAFKPGEVSIKFNSNTNGQAYTIKQRASNWDSQAVLDNYVTAESSRYLTYSEQGLTVYTFDNKAAWVNGGVLYTIDGDAPLSSEQVLRIAASL